MASFIALDFPEKIGSLKDIQNQNFLVYHLIDEPLIPAGTSSKRKKFLTIYGNTVKTPDRVESNGNIVTYCPVSEVSTSLVQICQDNIKHETENIYVVGEIAESNLVINYCKKICNDLVADENRKLRQQYAGKVVNIKDIKQIEKPTLVNVCYLTGSKNMKSFLEKLSIALQVDVAIDITDPVMVLAACSHYIQE